MSFVFDRYSYFRTILATVRLPSDTCVAVILFALSALVRLVFYYFNRDLTTYETISGVPFSDARHWNEAALSLARGGGFVGHLRPLYPLTLALFYTWSGSSFFVAKCLNIACSSCTVSLVYLVGRRSFGFTVGFLASLLMIFDPASLNRTLTIMTEPLGLLLFVLSVHLWVLGVERKNGTLLLLSGLTFALCNLARTMTLAAFPAYVLLTLLVNSRNGVPLRRNAVLVACFATAAFMALVPWIVRQHHVFGIWALAPNSANLIYAATSPQHQQWTGLETAEAVERGYVSIKDQHGFFNRKAIKNLTRYPLFFAANFVRSVKELVSNYRCPASPIPAYAEIFVCLLGAAWAVLRRRNSGTLMLLVSAASVVAGSAIVANAGVSPRMFSMMSWMFDYFYLFGLVSVMTLVWRLALHRKNIPIPAEQSTFPRQRPTGRLFERALKIGGLALVTFVVLSLGRIIWLRAFPPPASEPVHVLNLQEKRIVLEAINARRPGTFAGIDAALSDSVEPENELVNDPDDQKNNGKLVVKLDKLDPYVYFIPWDKSVHPWFRLLTARSYDRTIFSMGQWGWVFYATPGRVPEKWIGRDVIVVGRLRVDMAFDHESRRIVESIAIMPYDGKVVVGDMMVATESTHWRFVDGM